LASQSPSSRGLRAERPLGGEQSPPFPLDNHDAGSYNTLVNHGATTMLDRYIDICQRLELAFAVICGLALTIAVLGSFALLCIALLL
jgi:hypothetical protein